MSRAFVKEDAGEPPRRFALPRADDPGYDAAAAYAMLEAACDGDTKAAEKATGYLWGAEALRPHVERMLAQEEERGIMEQDSRLITVARRYLRGAS